MDPTLAQPNVYADDADLGIKMTFTAVYTVKGAVRSCV